MTLHNGERLGPYEILGSVGAGGMGEVYKARDTRLQREVAVKVLPLGRLEDAGALRRFEQEARTLAALNHPNLLTVHDLGTTDGGALYLVTELLEGATLRERMTPGKLPQRTAVDYGMQLARGLAAAHDKGIIHRDLKPENIFCTADGRIKILDFGLAKLTAETGAEDKTVAEGGTAAGVVLGTVGYMAPEQARGQAADARSDIFSLGCVLYEMLAGRRAFRGESAADVISAILREDPPELIAPGSASSAAAVPVALERIVRHCLEKEPRQRFQSASDVAFSLADLSSASTAASGAMAPVEAPGGGRRRWAFATLGTVGLVVAAALGWWWAQKPVSAVRFQRITYEQGRIADARFLPDGQGAIGAAQWNNQPISLFTTRLDTPGTQQLSGAERLLAVARGEAAVLQNERSLGGYAVFGTLARMPLSGGAPRPVLESVGAADYAPGTTELAITRFNPAKNNFTLEYPIGHVLYTDTWIAEPRFSRDGREIAFLAHEGMGDDQGTVGVVDLDGQVKVLTPHFTSVQGVAWSPKGDEIWFTAALENNLRDLRAVTLSGRQRVLLASPIPLQLRDVAGDGRLLLTTESSRISLDLMHAGDPLPRNMTVLDWSFGALLSDDGQELVIGDQDAGTNYSSYLRKADGSPPVRLGDGTPVAFSPDKQWAVSVVPSTQQLWLLPTGAGEPRQLSHGNVQYLPVRGTWLPDGRAVLAEGSAPGHGLRMYRVNLQGEAQPVTAEGVVGTVLTPDGQSLLEMRLGTGEYAAVSLRGGAAHAVPGLEKGDRPLRFSSDGRSLYVGHAGGISDEVWQIDVASGRRQKLYSVLPAVSAGIGAMRVASISADGKTYLVGYQQVLTTLFVMTGVR